MSRVDLTEEVLIEDRLMGCNPVAELPLVAVFDHRSPTQSRSTRRHLP
jgi:hypothetical protein